MHLGGVLNSESAGTWCMEVNLRYEIGLLQERTWLR